MSDDHLAIIDALYQRFEPADVVERSSWLFAHWPRLPDGGDDLSQSRQRADGYRVDAAQDWYASLGTNAFLGLCERIESPDALGHALALTRLLPVGAEEAEFVRAALERESLAARSCGLAYLGAISTERGGETVPALLEKFADDITSSSE